MEIKRFTNKQITIENENANLVTLYFKDNELFINCIDTEKMFKLGVNKNSLLRFKAEVL